MFRNQSTTRRKSAANTPCVCKSNGIAERFFVSSVFVRFMMAETTIYWSTIAAMPFQSHFSHPPISCDWNSKICHLHMWWTNYMISHIWQPIKVFKFNGLFHSEFKETKNNANFVIVVYDVVNRPRMRWRIIQLWWYILKPWLSKHRSKSLRLHMDHNCSNESICCSTFPR